VFLSHVSDYASKGDMCFSGVSPFITKAGVSPIPSPITKAVASSIPYIERRALESCVSVLSHPYKAHSQLWQNIGGDRSYHVLSLFLPFLNLVVMKHNSCKS
jgi:hypothetical protein